jgi:hypothetical protein
MLSLKLKTRTERNRASAAVDECLARAIDIRVNSTDNVYGMLSESRAMYGLAGGWKETIFVAGCVE